MPKKKPAERKALDLSCLDWFDRLKAGKYPVADIKLNDSAANAAENFYNRLVLPDVPGQPTMREAAGAWGSETIRHVFGTLKPDRTRNIREFFILVPKKNAKTTNGAAIMVTALLMNKRPRANFLLLAPTHDIAIEAFEQAAGMIENDPAGYLQKRFKITEHTKTIQDIAKNVNGENNPGFQAKLKIKTFDTKVVTGAKPVGILIDELHVLGKSKDASKVMKQLRGGIIANPEAFMVTITTQSDEPPVGIFKTDLEYARRIRDGEITGDTLPILYEFPLEMQADKNGAWKDPANWPIVLPNLGHSIDVERLISEYDKAENKGIEEFTEWASQHLNIQIGIAMSKDRWRGVEFWLPAADKSITLESLLERSEVAVVGIDGGGHDDLFGLSVIGREKRTDEDDETMQRWFSWSKAWAYPEALEQRKENVSKMEQFKRQGDLVICEYPNQDAIEAAEICAQINTSGLFPEKYGIGVDAVGVSEFIDELNYVNIGDELIAAVAQGYRLSGTIHGLERRLKAGTLQHDGSDMMIWCVGNCRVELRGNAVLITKQISGRAKIDPVIAILNAFFLMSRHPVAAAGQGSYLSETELVVM